ECPLDPPGRRPAAPPRAGPRRCDAASGQPGSERRPVAWRCICTTMHTLVKPLRGSFWLRVCVLHRAGSGRSSVGRRARTRPAGLSSCRGILVRMGRVRHWVVGGALGLAGALGCASEGGGNTDGRTDGGAPVGETEQGVATYYDFADGSGACMFEA